MGSIIDKLTGTRRPPRRRIGALGGKVPSHPGRHHFRVVAADHRYAREEGSETEVLELQLEITGGDDAGLRVRVYMALTEMGEEDLVDLLQAIDEFDEEAEFDPDVLVGKSFEALLDREDRFYTLSDIQAA